MTAEEATPDAVDDQTVADGDPGPADTPDDGPEVVDDPTADDDDSAADDTPDPEPEPAGDDSDSAYVVTSDVLYHTVDGVRRRYKRGDTITGLSDDTVARYSAASAIAKPSSGSAQAAQDEPGDDLRPAPDAGQPTPDTASHITAAAASGVAPIPRPPTAAGVAIWRKYAIARGLSEADVAGADKKTLQEITR